ncbi:MAG: STAS/SEC14 domain-containing protein [Myxococcota bacterium]
MPAPLLLDAEWPLVTLVIEGSFTDEELGVLLTQAGAYRARGEPFVLLVDARRADRPTPLQRKFMSDFSVAGGEQRRTLVGRAIVTGNPLVRGVIRVVELAAPPPYPSRVFAEIDDARRWLKTLLA